MKLLMSETLFFSMQVSGREESAIRKTFLHEESVVRNPFFVVVILPFILLWPNWNSWVLG